MKRFFKNRMFVSVLFSAVLTFVFVFAVAYSSTTISTDITTGGSATIGGTLTVSTAGSSFTGKVTIPYASTTALSATNIDATTYTSGTWNGTIIAPAYGGTGWASLQSNTVLLGNGASAIATTTAGTNGFVLALVGGAPTWAATTTLTTITGTLPVASGGTNIASYTAGDMLYASGVTTLTRIASSTDGKVLTLTNGIPGWAAVVASLGNTSPWTALQNFSAGASTTLFSTYGPSYFGATATSSFSSAGVLTLISPLGIASGGTGLTSFTPGDILYAQGLTTLTTLASSTGGKILSLSGNGAPIWISTSTLLSLSGGTMTGTLDMGAQSITMTGSLAATGNRVLEGWFTDVESTNMPTVNGTSLSSTFAPKASPSFTGTLNVGGLATTTLNGVVQLVATTTAPGACVASLAGGLAYHSTYGKLCLCNGTAWVYATSSDGAACGTW